MANRGERPAENLNRRRLLLTLIPVLVAAAAAVAGVWYFYIRAPDIMTLRIAADERGSESYELITAISEVAQQSGSLLRIEVIPTSGSNENLSLLTSGKADLASLQADAVFPHGLTLVASLYPEFFQLLVRQGLSIRDFGDVAGKRVALADPSSGQYRSFWLLANQYGLPAEQLRVTTTRGVDLIRELREGSVDAVFRVRPSRTRELRLLIDNAGLSFVPIAQGEAIHLRYPVLNAAILPKGAYRGSPPVPEFDLPTVTLDRLLVASSDADSSAIRELTSILFEKRRDLSQRNNLAGFIRAPDLSTGTLLPVHSGSISYYDREKPSFLEANSDLIGVLISIAAVLYSAFAWIKSRIEEGRKGRIDVYNLELARLNEEIGRTGSMPELDRHREQLYTMLNRVIRDLDEDKVGEDGFQTFAFTWGAVQKAVDDRRGMIRLSDETRQFH
jgi:TRAP transporter TAXI family solute receptor